MEKDSNSPLMVLYTTVYSIMDKDMEKDAKFSPMVQLTKATSTKI